MIETWAPASATPRPSSNYYDLWTLVGRPFCGLSKSRWSRAARPRGRQRPQAAALTRRPSSA